MANLKELTRKLVNTYVHTGRLGQVYSMGTQNSLGHPSTNLTPFQCILGFQPPLNPWNGNIMGIQAADQWFQHSKQVWASTHQPREILSNTRKPTLQQKPTV